MSFAASVSLAFSFIPFSSDYVVYVCVAFECLTWILHFALLMTMKYHTAIFCCSSSNLIRFPFPTILAVEFEKDDDKNRENVAHSRMVINKTFNLKSMQFEKNIKNRQTNGIGIKSFAIFAFLMRTISYKS